MKQDPKEPHWLDDLSDEEVDGLSDQLIRGFAGNSYEVITPKLSRSVVPLRRTSKPEVFGFLTAA